jgi:hypothetical protein
MNLSINFMQKNTIIQKGWDFCCVEIIAENSRTTKNTKQK